MPIRCCELRLGALTLSSPIPRASPRAGAKTRVLPYDVEAMKELFRREGQSIAAVIVEPIAAIWA